MRKLLLLLSLILGFAVGATVHAQVRTLPANAKRIVVGQQQFSMPYVDLGNKQVKLAPGAVIYDQNNRSIVHSALPPGADVVFTIDMQGDVARIYVLTPTEQVQLNQRKR
jgi:hypothetical protein